LPVFRALQFLGRAGFLERGFQVLGAARHFVCADCLAPGLLDRVEDLLGGSTFGPVLGVKL
jgi:hypothetical protein